MMSWREVKGKYVVTSNGAHLSFTVSELSDLKKILDEIEKGGNNYRLDDNRSN